MAEFGIGSFGLRSTINSLVKSRMPIKAIVLISPFLLFPSLVIAPMEEDFDRSLTECLFYTIPDIPELHYFYEVYHPWPYDKPNWGSTK